MSERLTREQIAEVTRFYQGPQVHALADTALFLMDENERLRGALQGIGAPHKFTTDALTACAALADTEEGTEDA